jgi:hypothetical protein
MPNTFRWPNHEDFTILDANNQVIGHVRVKPTSISYKPSGRGKWRQIKLDRFAELAEEHGTLVNQ